MGPAVKPRMNGIDQLPDSRQPEPELASCGTVRTDVEPGSPSGGFVVRAMIERFVRNNWKVALYVILIVLCVLFAPEEPLKFIYTEF